MKYLVSIFKISALVWLSSIFWFSLDFFYVIFVRKQLFNQVPTIFTIVLLGLIALGSFAFLSMVLCIIIIALRKAFLKRKYNFDFGIIPLLAVIILLLILTNDKNDILLNKILGINKESIKISNQEKNPTSTPTQTVTPTPTTVYKPTNTASPGSSSGSSNANDPWGVAKQVSEHSWTMKIGFDDKMGTAQEIYDALNNYRKLHGSGYLAWDNNLAIYAQSRADYFVSIGKMDEHTGFIEFTKNIDNLRQKLNFYHVGENSSYGFRLSGVHVIEWMYAGDKPHNDNQLNSSWTHVGVGVNGTATDLIFGE